MRAAGRDLPEATEVLEATSQAREEVDVRRR